MNNNRTIINKIAFHLARLAWTAVTVTSVSCAVPLEDEDLNEPDEQGEVSHEDGAATPGGERSSCGGPGQRACFSFFGRYYYCHYNLVIYQNPPYYTKFCGCTGTDEPPNFTWAGESLACVSSYCMSDNEVNRKLEELKDRSDLGWLTAEALNTFSLNSKVGSFQAQENYYYRATSFTKEIEHMQTNMRTLAKAHFRTINWPMTGPSIRNLSQALMLPLQLLATSSSDRPKSQFTSAALTFEVARTFAADGAYVYAFKLNPQSNILGLTRCGGAALVGELQVQVPNGTEIKSLRRKKATGGDWEYWSTSAKVWKKSKCNRNSPKWQCPPTDVRDEL